MGELTNSALVKDQDSPALVSSMTAWRVVPPRLTLRLYILESADTKEADSVPLSASFVYSLTVRQDNAYAMRVEASPWDATLALNSHGQTPNAYHLIPNTYDSVTSPR
jgi:hypothetical protein